MSLEYEAPGHDEIETEHSSFDTSDADWSDSSRRGPATPNHSSRVKSESFSTPSPSLDSHPKAHDAVAATWLGRIASERGLAASLDHLDAKDLAAHLYNAFALNQRARNLRSRNEANDQVDDHVWDLPRLWTAWPLNPAFVPAEDEGLQWESENYLNGPSSSKKFTPREALEDILLSRFQKVAKERFLKKYSGDGSSENSKIHPDEDEEDDLLEPVVMADDDFARSLTEPSLHHIFAKLDGLLTTLHEARYAYAVTQRSASYSHDETSSRGHQQKRKSKQKRKYDDSEPRKTEPGTSNNSSASEVDDELDGSDQSNSSIAGDVERSEPKSQSATRRKRWKRIYELRDWSDVIGVASLTNWEPKTVQRAAIRCASLFNEGMKFRTLEENGNVGDEISILPNTRLEGTESDNPGDTLVRQEGEDQDQDPEQAPRYCCLIPDCPRSSDGFPARWRLNAHMRKVHKQKPPPRRAAPYKADEGQDQNQDPAPISKPRRTGLDKQGSLYYCPIPNCPRSSEGFRARWNLHAHLRRVHKHEPNSPSAMPYKADDDDDDDMVGGVHVNGFLQPVPMPSAWVYNKRGRAKAKAKAEEQAKAEVEVKKKAESEEQAKAEGEVKKKAKAKAEGKVNEKAKAKAEGKVNEKANAKAEGEVKKKAEAEEQAKAEGEAKAKAKMKTKTKGKTEEEAKAKAEREVKAKAKTKEKEKENQREKKRPRKTKD